MNLSEYARHDALGLADLVRRKQISRKELASVALEAVAAVNPTLNAVVETYELAEDVLKDDFDGSDAVFCGVPFLLADIGAHRSGAPQELGSRLARGMRTPPVASELVERFRKTGLTFLGRTNIAEFGISSTTEPLLHGSTLNPWSRKHSPGGSAGGAAAAVGSGMVPIAHAVDSSGCIRWSASCTGLFGLKPSRNLNPVGPDAALPTNGLAAEHIVSKSVRDSAAMLDATAGRDRGAWCYTPRMQGSYLREAAVAPGRLRIGLNPTSNFPGARVQKSVVDAVRKASRLCESLGHHVEEVAFDFDYELMLRASYVIWVSGIRRDVLDLSMLTGRLPSNRTLEPHILRAYEEGESLPAADLQGAISALNQISRAYGAYFERFDVMLTPTGSVEAPRLSSRSAITARTFSEWHLEMRSICPFTESVNMAGLPAMSVPLGQSASGLPIGCQFIAGLGEEARLLRLASQLESACPWIDRRPAVFAGSSA